MIAKIYSAIPHGYAGHIVEVEGDANRGLPGFNLVGMANKTIFEARERVRSALTNSGFTFPQKKVTVSLAPAELAKDGSHLDLPIALAILGLSQQLLVSDVANRLFVGELALDGALKPVRGIINVVETARDHGYTEVFVPRDNLAEASLIAGIKIYGIDNLIHLFLHLKGQYYLPDQSQIQDAKTRDSVVKITSTDKPPQSDPGHIAKATATSTTKAVPVVKTTLAPAPKAELTFKTAPILDDVQGQTLAKRALVIAIAGHHNLLLTGPPGAGKTMLARVATGLLPELSPSEQVEIAKIQSLSGIAQVNYCQRPFRAPHHSASPASVIGGSAQAIPGEISLAHRGILFLDELPEYPRIVLESLRQPLEDGEITISRAQQHVTYPADFMLIATMNPCPCGYAGDLKHACICSPFQLQNYRSRISGPIRDRIDLIIKVNRVKTSDLSLPQRPTAHHSKSPATCQPANQPQKRCQKDTNSDTPQTEHIVVKNTITEARYRQAERYGRPDYYNSSLSSAEVAQYIPLSTPVRQLLDSATERFDLSARSYYKVIKVARTIADLDNSTEVKIEHISEALALRDTEC